MRRGSWPHLIHSHIPAGPNQAKDAAGGARAASGGYRGYADVARAVFRSGGLKGFYAGIIPEYYKVRLVTNLLLL